jgi:hypothetical protein
MGYSGKAEPQTHEEHSEALKRLNVYQDKRIDQIFSTLDKIDFC